MTVRIDRAVARAVDGSKGVLLSDLVAVEDAARRSADRVVSFRIWESDDGEPLLLIQEECDQWFSHGLDADDVAELIRFLSAIESHLRSRPVPTQE